MNREIHFYDSVGSTNDIAKASALREAVFVAKEQTNGKGSKGRSWQSNKDEGLYMSFLLRPKMKPQQVQGLTLMAAVVVCEAVQKHTDEKVGIKWPNDVLICGKKAAGILTESILGADGVERVVCGIGINTNQSFTGELSKRACSLPLKDEAEKEELSKDIIDSFFEAYEKFAEKGLGQFMPEYRMKNALSGKLRIISGSVTTEGIFKEIDDNGAIVINTGDGIKRFVAGEITIRGENGYA